MTLVHPVKGTRDFFPQEMAFRIWLYGHIKSVSEAFGYKEFEGPYLERLELYAAKSGEELVKEQSFVFPDRSGDMVALRPELTPTLARMIAAHGRSLPKPIRWWSFGPFWRYERPQRGRTREFFQWNIDLIGIDTPQGDAELVSIIAAFFERIGLGPDKVIIKINDRRLVESRLRSLGIASDKMLDVFHFIDRKEKMPHDDWKSHGRDLGLDEDKMASLEEFLADEETWKDSEELVGFFQACEAMGIRDYLAYDPKVIRGLDYYTGIVFEARDAEEDERAVLGGGRYDNLVADVGGEPIPGVGFAMGDVVLALILEKYGLTPEIRVNPSDILVVTFDEDLLPHALTLATELRSAGFKVEWYPLSDRISKQFRYANKQDIPLVAILGPDEMNQHQVTIKDMRSRKQETINRDALIDHVAALLEPPELS